MGNPKLFCCLISTLFLLTTGDVYAGGFEDGSLFHDLTVLNSTIEPGGRVPTAVVGIYAGGRNLRQVSFDIIPESPDKNVCISQFAPFTTTTTSGFALYRNDASVAEYGTLVQTGFSYRQQQDETGSYFRVTLRLIEAYQSVAQCMEVMDSEYVLVLRASNHIRYQDAFRVRIHSKDVDFATVCRQASHEELVTQPIVANVPVFFTDLARNTELGRADPGQVGLPVPVMGINLSSGTTDHPNQPNERLVALKLRVERATLDSSFSFKDLAPLSADGAESGVALYRDDGLVNGVFDAQDTPLRLAVSPTVNDQHELVLVLETPQELPTHDEFNLNTTVSRKFFGPDFFVVVRTSDAIARSSEFVVEVAEVVFEHSVSRPQFTTEPVMARAVNEPPSIALLNPQPNDQAAKEFLVRWNDQDPDSDALINLYYIDRQVFNQSGGLPGVIGNPSLYSIILGYPNEQGYPVQAINLPQAPEGADGEFVWHTARLPLGLSRTRDYYVLASIRDEVNPVVWDNSPSWVTVTNEAPTALLGAPGNPVTHGFAFNIGVVAQDREEDARMDVFLIDNAHANDVPDSWFAGNMNQSVQTFLAVEGVHRVNSVVLPVTASTTAHLTVSRSLSSALLVPGEASRTYQLVGWLRDAISGVKVVGEPITIIQNQPPEFEFIGPLAQADLPENPIIFRPNVLSPGLTEYEQAELQRFEINWTASDPENDVDNLPVADLRYYNNQTQHLGEAVSVRGYTSDMVITPETMPIAAVNIPIYAVQSDYSFIWDLQAVPAGLYVLHGQINDHVNTDSDEAFLLINRPSVFALDGVSPGAQFYYIGQSFDVVFTGQHPEYDDQEQYQLIMTHQSGTPRYVLNPFTTFQNGTGNFTVQTNSIGTNRVRAEVGDYTIQAVIRVPEFNTLVPDRTLSQTLSVRLRENQAPLVTVVEMHNDLIVAANPTLDNPVVNQVVADGNAVIPVVWFDDDPDQSGALVSIEARHTTQAGASWRKITGTYPGTSIINSEAVGIPVNTDNGDDPMVPQSLRDYIADNAEAWIGEPMTDMFDVFLWEITDTATWSSGTYELRMIVTDTGLPQQVYEVGHVTINRKPHQIKLTGPETSTPQPIGKTLEISWVDAIDPDSPATISLSYAIVAPGYDPTRFIEIPAAQAILASENGEGSFAFDTNLIDTHLSDSFGLRFRAIFRDEANATMDELPATNTAAVTMIPNEPPRFCFVDPACADLYDEYGNPVPFTDRYLTISWENIYDDLPDTTFALFYSRYRYGGGGTPITQPSGGIDPTAISFAEPSGSYLWDTSTAPPGYHYIYAYTNDGYGQYFFYTDCPVLINRKPTLCFHRPDCTGEMNIVQQGDTYTISWQATDPDIYFLDDSGNRLQDPRIHLYLDSSDIPGSGYLISVDDLTILDLSEGIPIGTGFGGNQGDFGSLMIDTSSVAPGTYTLVANVNDGVSPPFFFSSLTDNCSLPSCSDDDRAGYLIVQSATTAPSIIVTHPSIDAHGNPAIIYGPTMEVRWQDDIVDLNRLRNSYIQLFWDTQYYGQNGTLITGTNVAADGSVLNAEAIPVRLPEPEGIILTPEQLERDYWIVDTELNNMPREQVLYLYARITDDRGHNWTYSRRYYASNAFILNSSPSFEFILPSVEGPNTNQRGNPYECIYEAIDIDSDAMINFFLVDVLEPDLVIPVVNPGQNVPERDGVDSIIFNFAQVIDAASVETRLPDGTVLPATRDYRLRAVMTDGHSRLEVDSPILQIGPNTPPSVTVFTPPTGVTLRSQKETYRVEWFDYDPDSPEFKVDLFYNLANLVEDGIILDGTYSTAEGLVYTSARGLPGRIDNGPIVDGVWRDHFEWSLANVPSATYYVGVAAYDGATRVVSYSPGQLVVNNPPELTFTAPLAPGVELVQGDKYEITWMAYDDDPDTVIKLYLDYDTNPHNGRGILLEDTLKIIPGGGPGSYVLDTSILPVPSVADSYTVLAVVQDRFYDPIHVYAPGTITVKFNHPPTIQVIKPWMMDLVWDMDPFYTIRWIAEDPDSDATIRLYLDREQYRYEGFQVGPDEISENHDPDYYTLDTSTIAPGQYYVYASIDDGFNPVVYSYSINPFHIVSCTETVAVGMRMLDGYGTVFSLGNVSREFYVPYFGFDIARGFEVTPDGQNMYILDGYGAVHEPNLKKLNFACLPYDFGTDRYVDIEVARFGTGYYVLDQYGQVFSCGTDIPNLNTYLGLPGGDRTDPYAHRAVDLELSCCGRGAYVLDSYGNIYTIGEAPSLGVYPRFEGRNLARDLELTEKGGFVLDAWGAVHPLLGESRFTAPEDPPYFFGYDRAADLVVVENAGYYLLDTFGGIHVYGDDRLLIPRNDFGPNPYFGWDIARDLGRSGLIDTTDDREQAGHVVRRFGIAFRDHDQESMEEILSDWYRDGVYASKEQLMDGIYDPYQEDVIMVLGMLAEWENTVASDGSPHAAFYFTDIIPDQRDCSRQVQVTAHYRRIGYRSHLYTHVFNDMRVSPGMFTPEQRLQYLYPSNGLLISTPVDTEFRMDDYTDNQGIILYVDRIHNWHDPVLISSSEYFKYFFKRAGYESFTINLEGGEFPYPNSLYPDESVYFVSFSHSMMGIFIGLGDNRSPKFTYRQYQRLEDGTLTFTIQREDRDQWRIRSISGLNELIYSIP